MKLKTERGRASPVLSTFPRSEYTLTLLIYFDRPFVEANNVNATGNLIECGYVSRSESLRGRIYV